VREPQWFSLRAALAAFGVSAAVGCAVLFACLGLDAVLGTRIATDEDGLSVPGSVAMVLTFVPAYGLFLNRFRR
jgi:hypothetical protein